MSGNAFEEFRRSLEQFRAVVGYRSIDVGIIYMATDGGSQCLVFHAEVGRKPERAGEYVFRDGGVYAYRACVDFEANPAFVDDLLAQFDARELRRLDEPLEAAPIRMRRPDHETEWRFEEERYQHRSTLATSWNFQLHDLVPKANWRAIDRMVSVKSGRRWASLSRLSANVCGRPLESNYAHAFDVEIPWPVRKLDVEFEPGGGRLIVHGIPGLDPKKFLLTFESTRDFQRSGAELQWAPLQEESGAQYVTRLPKFPTPVTAINLYIDGLDAVHLSVDTKRADRDLYEEPTRIEPIELGEGPVATPARLEQLTVQGYRGIQSATLDFTPSLAVLVGPNQSGKSTLLDALSMLRDAASGRLTEAVSTRGVLARLMHRSHETKAVAFGVTVARNDTRLRYSFSLRPLGDLDYLVDSEVLELASGTEWSTLLEVRRGQGSYRGRPVHVRESRELIIAQVRDAAAFPEFEIIRGALTGLAVYPYFRTGASWARTEPEGMRSATRVDPLARLHPVGGNLAAVLQRLRDAQPEDWEELVAVLRMVFPTLRDVRMPPVGVGQVALRWDDSTVEGGVDASELSDGTLQFLCALAALYQEGDSLVAIDEPERGLHPEALYRLVGVARKLSERRPVLFATQSDALIDMLDDMPEALVIAEKVEGASRFVRPDAETLRKWAREFGLASMRRELEAWEPET